MKQALAILMMLSLALAGCSDDSSTSPPDTDGSVEGDSANGNETGNASMPPANNETASNTAPTLVFASDVGQGAVPLTVTFSINGTDDEGDNMTWYLETGIEGSDPVAGDSLPANHTVTYEVEGSYTAIAYLSDGNETSQANITIVVSAMAAPVPGPFVVSGEILLPLPFCFDDGLGGRWHPYSDDLTGWNYVLDRSDMLAKFYNGSDQKGQSGTSGQVPAGANEVDICANDVTGFGDYVFTATHPDYLG